VYNILYLIIDTIVLHIHTNDAYYTHNIIYRCVSQIAFLEGKYSEENAALVRRAGEAMYYDMYDMYYMYYMCYVLYVLYV
jgi:hypothetical protein